MLKCQFVSLVSLQETSSLTRSDRSCAAVPTRCLRAGGQMGEEAARFSSLRSGRGLYLSTVTLAVSPLRGTSAIIAVAHQPIRAQLWWLCCF